MSIEMNKEYFKGTNFVTPIILEYFENDTIIIELSKSSEKLMGTGKYGYGVTVVDKYDREIMHPDSTLLFDETLAREYIANLLGGSK